MPEGREAQWSDFSSWFARNRIAFRELDAHQAFEEIRGVIAADAQGVLTRDGYRGLGVRQSIFLDRQREALAIMSHIAPEISPTGTHLTLDEEPARDSPVTHLLRPGLRGGTFSYDGDNFPVFTISLTGCLLSQDVTVSGTIDWNYFDGTATADLVVAGPGTAGGTLL